MEGNEIDDLLDNAFKPPEKGSVWADIKLYIKALVYSGAIYTIGIFLLTIISFFVFGGSNFWQYQINLAAFFFIIGVLAKALKIMGRYSALTGISTIVSWTNTAGGAERSRKTWETAMQDFRKSVELVGWDVSFIFASVVLAGISLLIGF